MEIFFFKIFNFFFLNFWASGNNMLFGTKNAQNDMSFNGENVCWLMSKTTCHFSNSRKWHVVFVKRLNKFIPYTTCHFSQLKNDMLFNSNDSYSSAHVVFHRLLHPFWPVSNLALRTPFWAVQITKLS